MNTDKPIIILGLGNPGAEYKNTFHNLGEIFVKKIYNDLKSEWGLAPWKKDSAGKFLFSTSSNKKIVLSLSESFMNESGMPVKNILKKFGVPIENLLVLHDDSDIRLGFAQIAFGKNSAGHKGVENIINKLGVKYFWRLRVGSRALKSRQASEFVLKKISSTKQKDLDKLCEKIIKGVKEFAFYHPDKATNIINSSI
ncbi:MAG: Peptidyl-tRNA hydrolase [Parcubacteria group bacterium GW2011_GWA2_39_18]|nr:MAG: Peptidyl-tRNA hydrolase [Parcubacteria group bacterium GW2011_GWA2_39_18]